MHVKRAAYTFGAVGSAAVLALTVAGSASADGFSHAWNNSNSVNQCLALGGSTLGNATVMWNCDSESGQSWFASDTWGGSTEIQNAVDTLGAGSCLDSMGYGPGSHVYVEACDDSINQSWYAIPSGAPNANEWVNEGTGNCLAVAGGSTANGAKVITWACHDTVDEQWGGSLG